MAAMASAFREMSLDEDGRQGVGGEARDEALDAIGNDNVLSALAFLDLRDLASASATAHAWSELASSSEALWTAQAERRWEGRAYVVPSLVKMAGGAAAVAAAEEEERATLKSMKISELKAKASRAGGIRREPTNPLTRATPPLRSARCLSRGCVWQTWWRRATSSTSSLTPNETAR